jgi:hypothetical protein
MIRGLPPYAGVTSPADAQRLGLTVVEATGRLHRLAYMKQRLAIAAAAFLPSTPEWEAKCALALHGWLDAEHATMLYGRLAELREPSPGPDDIPDAALRDGFDELLAAPDTGTRLAAIHGAVRPHVRLCLDEYLQTTNWLCDQPSVRVLHHIRADEEQIHRWGEAALAAVTSDVTAADWQGHLTAALAGSATLRSRFQGPYEFDVSPRRDERFDHVFDVSTPADVVYPDEERPFDERNAALMFKRLREMDVPEVIAGIVSQRWAEERNAGARGRPWAYYASMLRQMWDEARHAMLGQALLESRGIDWTALPVNATFSWKLGQFCTPVERHILLYAIEQSLMPKDHGKPYEYRVAVESGDRLSALFHDYDWADEVLHVEIARRCLRPELPGGLSEARQRSDALWARISDALEREPLPGTNTEALGDWWPRFARQVIGREPSPVRETHIKDWRPE